MEGYVVLSFLYFRQLAFILQLSKNLGVMEHLEILVQNNETELQMIEDLRKTIEHLEHEETKKADERLKYARDIEQVEEHYKVREWAREIN